jgi:hypothetical protein
MTTLEAVQKGEAQPALSHDEEIDVERGLQATLDRADHPHGSRQTSSPERGWGFRPLRLEVDEVVVAWPVPRPPRSLGSTWAAPRPDRTNLPMERIRWTNRD